MNCSSTAGVPEGPLDFTSSKREKLLKLCCVMSIEYRFTHNLDHLELQLRDAERCFRRPLKISPRSAPSQ